MMESKSIDLRIVRTRQLLVDAFLKVSREKKLPQIIVRDITGITTLNHAILYAHFTDKEGLLDCTLSVTILEDLSDNLSISNVISEKTLRNIFISTAGYIKDAARFYKLDSEAFYNRAHQYINDELENIFTIILENSYPEHQRDIIINSTSSLAVDTPGLALHWFNMGRETAGVFTGCSLPLLIHHTAHF